jgi:hypothetical protein
MGALEATHGLYSQLKYLWHWADLHFFFLPAPSVLPQLDLINQTYCSLVKVISCLTNFFYLVKHFRGFLLPFLFN